MGAVESSLNRYLNAVDAAEGELEGFLTWLDAEQGDYPEEWAIVSGPDGFDGHPEDHPDLKESWARYQDWMFDFDV